MGDGLSLAPPPDGRCDLPLEPLDQLPVGCDEGLLGFDLGDDGKVYSRGLLFILFFRSVGCTQRFV